MAKQPEKPQPSPGEFDGEFDFVPPPEEPGTVDPSDTSRKGSGESWEPSRIIKPPPSSG